ncbi:MAG: ribosome silencing factor [Endozoicomonadaceae bacterium]|nr:ribosome silencing factor [Endozoicomonadaceae bacterium]
MIKSIPLQLALNTLDQMKGENIVFIDVQKKTSFTDTFVFVNGTSTRHVSALAKHLRMHAKKNKISVLNVDQQKNSDWVLIDLGDTIVHIMTEKAREFYDIESLWQSHLLVNE